MIKETLPRQDAQRFYDRIGRRYDWFEIFDLLYIAYVLDLIPLEDIHPVLAEFIRVLRPGGRLTNIALTESVNFPSRGLVGL